jgi:hypothetical protein
VGAPLSLLPPCLQVSGATRALYEDTMRSAQAVPGLLDDLGDIAGDVGDLICQ